MPVLEIDNRRLSYEDYGSGPVALLIHGSPGNAKAWARVGQRLADRYRVIALDLPGYGDTTPQPAGDEPRVAYASELVEALVRHIGPPAVLAAHSYGGVVALDIALRGKVPVAALALFEPVAMKLLVMTGEAEAYAKARSTFDDYIASFEGGDGRAVHKMVDFWFGEGAFGRLPPPVSAYLLGETASNIRDVRATFGEQYTTAALAQLRLPMVTVVGDRSPDVMQRIVRALGAHVPGSTVTTFEQADHALITTHADAVARTIAGVAAVVP